MAEIFRGLGLVFMILVVVAPYYALMHLSDLAHIVDAVKEGAKALRDIRSELNMIRKELEKGGDKK